LVSPVLLDCILAGRCGAALSFNDYRKVLVLNERCQFNWWVMRVSAWCECVGLAFASRTGCGRRGWKPGSLSSPRRSSVLGHDCLASAPLVNARLALLGQAHCGRGCEQWSSQPAPALLPAVSQRVGQPEGNITRQLLSYNAKVMRACDAHASLNANLVWMASRSEGEGNEAERCLVGPRVQVAE
jgi:hypothetical protein